MYFKIAFLAFSLMSINFCNAAEQVPALPLKDGSFAYLGNSDDVLAGVSPSSSVRSDHSLGASTPSSEDAKGASVNSFVSSSADTLPKAAGVDSLPKSANVSVKQEFIDRADANVRHANATTNLTKKAAFYEAAAVNFAEAAKNEAEDSAKKQLVEKAADCIKLAGEFLLKVTGGPDDRVATFFNKSAQLYYVCGKIQNSAAMYEQAGDNTVSISKFREFFNQASALYKQIRDAASVARVADKKLIRMINGESEAVRNNYAKITAIHKKVESATPLDKILAYQEVVALCENSASLASDSVMQKFFQKQAAEFCVTAGYDFARAGIENLGPANREFASNISLKGAVYYETEGDFAKAAGAYLNAAITTTKAAKKSQLFKNAAVLYERAGNSANATKMQGAQAKVDKWIKDHPGVEDIA